MTMIDGLRSNINSILAIRDDLGAAKKPVLLVTRTWTGSEPGDGTFTDGEIPVLPSPAIKEFVDDYRIQEGGAVKQGDIRLKWISKQSFPTRAEIDCSVSSQKIEKFYKVGGVLYRVVQVGEQLLSWNVLLRRVNG